MNGLILKETGADDQSVKVWKISELNFKNPPNKRKGKNKKLAKAGAKGGSRNSGNGSSEESDEDEFNTVADLKK